MTIKGDKISIVTNKELDSSAYTFKVVLTDSYSGIVQKSDMVVDATCVTKISDISSIADKEYFIGEKEIVIDARVF